MYNSTLRAHPYFESCPAELELTLEDFLAAQLPGHLRDRPAVSDALGRVHVLILGGGGYPARIIVDYFADKYGLSGAQCRAYGGPRDVVARLTAPVERVVTSANIERVDADGESGAARATFGRTALRSTRAIRRGRARDAGERTVSVLHGADTLLMMRYGRLSTKRSESYSTRTPL